MERKARRFWDGVQFRFLTFFPVADSDLAWSTREKFKNRSVATKWFLFCFVFLSISHMALSYNNNNNNRIQSTARGGRRVIRAHACVWVCVTPRKGLPVERLSGHGVTMIHGHSTTFRKHIGTAQCCHTACQRLFLNTIIFLSAFPRGPRTETPHRHARRQAEAI